MRARRLRLSPDVFDLSRFTAFHMMSARRVLRELSRDAGSMEEVAHRVVGYFYDNFAGPEGQPAFALARFFKTHLYSGLADPLRKVADKSLKQAAPPKWMRCLVLLSTRGVEAAWNDPKRSVDHRVIPLVSEEMVRQAPMISGLIQQMGLSIEQVVRPNPAPLPEKRDYNVFHVPEAKGSPLIPNQREFVEPYKIESVLGFGSAFLNGDMFAVILFSKVAIPTQTAELFRALTLNVKLAVLPFLTRTFDE